MTLEKDFNKTRTSLVALKEKLETQSFTHPVSAMTVTTMKKTIDHFIKEISAMTVIMLTLKKFEDVQKVDKKGKINGKK